MCEDDGHRFWIFFSFWEFEELCSRNLFLLDILSISNFTLRCWGDWERMYTGNTQNCWMQLMGFFIMTVPQLTHNFVCDMVFSLSGWAGDFFSLLFFCFWQRSNLNKVEIRHHALDEDISAGAPQQHYAWGVPKLLQTNSGRKGWTYVLTPMEIILKGTSCFFVLSETEISLLETDLFKGGGPPL